MKNLHLFDPIITEKIPGSKYFRWHEALWLGSIESYAKPTPEQEANIIKLALIMDEIREYYNKPIIVNSWLRPRLYNHKIVGGATFSHHMSGNAIDFTVMGMNSDFVRADLKLHPELTKNCSFEMGVSWVHMQNDGRNNWFYPGPKAP